MKTAYTMSARKVVLAPEAQVVVSFKGGLVYTGVLAGLRQWAIENRADMPLSCHSEGFRHGIFPCLVATTERLAGALTWIAGAHVAVGDGSTFAGREQMRKAARSLMGAGFQLDEEAFQWGITEFPYEDQRKPKLLVQVDDEVPF